MSKSNKNFETRIYKTVSNVYYTIVAQPDILDGQEDSISRDDIQVAAHDFLEESRIINRNHTDEILPVSVVESWITKDSGVLGKESYVAGSWLIGLKVNDPTLDSQMGNEYNAVSIEGTGVRSPI